MAAPDPDEVPSVTSQFVPQGHTTEDVLKMQTIGLVTNADFRKRRAEAEQRAQSGVSTPQSGGSTPASSGVTSSQPPKKRQRKAAASKLSFGIDDDDDDDGDGPVETPKARTSRPGKPGETEARDPGGDIGTTAAAVAVRRGPNAAVGTAPKAVTQSALKAEAETRERLRREFLAMQEVVKATDMAIPFVFYDGTNVPGGVCTIKKGEHVWLFLDRARKAGAQLGMGGDRSRRDWARVGVDDLLLVRGDIIIPHHYEFYYFIVNRTKGFRGLLFDFSDRPISRVTAASATTAAAAAEEGRRADVEGHDAPSRPEARPRPSRQQGQLEGWDHDPAITKVVDRRWYERNKHIFPASVWEEFDPAKDYTAGIRKDTRGNAFFFT